ncbi:UNVERIFIED_CONTAM: Thioredoxin H2 [Sesamum latifolium]|uniref:Thioredoxin H2 n=1 Tax=Sesamum latifolium TaxID=2727402 RepID=A0AAW2UWV2_9LAMI
MGANFSSAYDDKWLPTHTNEPAPIKKVEARGFPTNTNESAPIKKVEARGFPTITNESAPAKKGQVITFRSSSKWKIHFEASKQTSKLIVIDFTASWCGPCQYMQPAINEFAEKYTDVEFIKIDVDELHDVAEEFGVQAMPTFILIKKGKEVDKVVGAKKDDLQKKIEKHRL